MNKLLSRFAMLFQVSYRENELIINQVLHAVSSKETQQFFFHQSNKNVWKWPQMESIIQMESD